VFVAVTNGLEEFAPTLFEGLVIAVAVSGLDKQGVRLADCLGVLDDELIFLPDVARENDLMRLIARTHPQFEDRGAQDMPRIAEGDGEARAHLDLLAHCTT